MDAREGSAALGARMRSALRGIVANIAVVTANDRNEVVGLTVSTFMPVSLEPPHVLVSLRSASHVTKAVLASGRFGISMLGLAHVEDAIEFARSFDPAAPPRRRDYARSRRETPLVPGALLAVDCDVVGVYTVATHQLVIGAVRELVCDAADRPAAGAPVVSGSAADAIVSRSPLLYHDGTYGHFSAGI